MKRKTKRIILVGQAASGKDYLASEFVKRGFRKDVSMTTRPMRNGEEEGVTYHYVSKEAFLEGVANNKFYEHVEFNGWMYGTLMWNWATANVFIMTPGGVASIKPEDRKDCIVVFLEIPEETRRKRISLRSDADSVERRIQADRKDFKGFIDYDYRINDENFNASVWVDLLNKASKLEQPEESFL